MFRTEGPDHLSIYRAARRAVGLCTCNEIPMGVGHWHSDEIADMVETMRRVRSDGHEVEATQRDLAVTRARLAELVADFNAWIARHREARQRCRMKKSVAPLAGRPGLS